MNGEEKQALKYFYNLRATIDESYMLFDEEINVKCGKETIKQISVVLNLIEKQQAELEKKDKIIDEMAEHIVSSAIVDDTVCAIKCDCDNGVECSHKKMLKCTKDYFKKKVEEK